MKLKRLLLSSTIVGSIGLSIALMGPTTPAYAFFDAGPIIAFLQQMQVAMQEFDKKMFGDLRNTQEKMSAEIAYNQERQMAMDMEVANSVALQQTDQKNEEMQKQAVLAFQATLEACRRITAARLAEGSGAAEENKKEAREKTFRDIANGDSAIYDDTESGPALHQYNVINSYRNRTDSLKGIVYRPTGFLGKTFGDVSEEEHAKAIEDTAKIIAGPIPEEVDPNDEEAVLLHAEAMNRWHMASSSFSDIAGKNSSVDGTSVFQILTADVEKAASDEELLALEELPSNRELLEDIARSMRIGNRIKNLALQEQVRANLIAVSGLAKGDTGARAIRTLNAAKNSLEGVDGN